MSLSVAIRHAFSGFALDVAFDAPAGVTALFGRSGSGKTTVVNALAGLIAVDAGHARVNGDTLFDTRERVFLAPHRRRIGYVFQEARLFPHMTVRQNLGYGRWFARRKGGEVADMESVVEMLGIGALLARRPGTLSGGQRAFIALARAFVSPSELLVLDEPTGNMDSRTEALFVDRLREKLQPEQTLVVATHRPALFSLCDRIIVLDQGRIVADGPKEQILAQARQSGGIEA